MIKVRYDFQIVPLAIDFRVDYIWADLTFCFKEYTGTTFVRHFGRSSGYFFVDSQAAIPSSRKTPYVPTRSVS
jgi:hypothetical protein